MDLSICIPVYNNKDLFQYCLEAIGRAIVGAESRVEIVISDNASEDDILGIVDEFREKYPDISIKFNLNEVNRGMAYNFHKVVEMSEGDFCWIIGSDDFVVKDGVKAILDVLDENPDIDFISVGYSLLFLDKIIDSTNKSDPYHNIPKVIDNSTITQARKVKKSSGRVDKWDTLIDPAYDNVMMGAIMAGVFRRIRWLSVNADEMDKSPEHSNVENTYPHCAVYARCMVGRPAYYLVEPVIVVGEGAREWMGKDFWDGSLPIIYFKILDEIVDAYRDEGLEQVQVEKCRQFTARIAGNYFIPFLYRRYILRKYIKNNKNIHLLNIIRRYWRYRTFYLGIKSTFTKRKKSTNNNIA